MTDEVGRCPGHPPLERLVGLHALEHFRMMAQHRPAMRPYQQPFFFEGIEVRAGRHGRDVQAL
jgi:hypothetical protein